MGYEDMNVDRRVRNYNYYGKHKSRASKSSGYSVKSDFTLDKLKPSKSQNKK